MKHIIYLTFLITLVLLSRSPVNAQVAPPWRGGTGTATTPTLGQVLVGQANGTYGPQATSTLGISVGTGLVTSTDPLLAASFSATGTATSTLPRLSITTALNLLGEYITDLTTWVRAKVDAYLSGGGGVTYSSGAISFDCSEVEGAGINCTGEDITLDVTGDWTGTLDGLNGSDLLSLSAWYATTTDGLDEGSSNRYYADGLARAAISENVTGLTYNNLTGVMDMSAGYGIPLTASTSEWATAYGWGNHATAGYLTTDSSFSTTSADYWDSTKSRWATSSSDYWLTTKSTTNLTEGSNLYYTLARFASALAGTTTDALTEGSTNRYYTDARVGDYISGSSTVPHTSCDTGEILEWSGSAWVCAADETGGAPAWGSITGTLSAQTDLQSELDAKLSLSAWYATTTDALDEGSNNLYFTPARGLASLTGQNAQAQYFTATSGTATSTFAGDVTLGINKRLSLSTDQTTGTNNSLIDLNFTDNEAKANITYRASSGKPVIWLAGHDYLSYPSNQHQHFSIETKRRLDDTLQSRFEVGWGCEDDECIVGVTSGADFRLGSASDLFQVDGDIKHGAAFDFFPNVDSGNTTIGLRVATTSNTTLSLSAVGTTELQIPENLTVVGTALVQGNSIVVDSEGTATFANDRAGTSNFGSFIWRTAGSDQWSFQLRNDSTNNIYLRDNINGRNFLQANQGGALIFDPTTNVGIGTTSPYAKLSVNGQTVASHFTATTSSTSTLPHLTGSFISGFGLTTCDPTTGKITYADGVFGCGTDLSGSGGAGLATSTAIADTQVIYGTGVGTVGSNAGLTYDTSASLFKLSSAAVAPYLRIQGASDGDNFGALEFWNSDASKKWQFAHQATGNFGFIHYSGGWSFPFTIEDDNDILIGSNSLNFNTGGTSGSNYKFAQDGDDLLTVQRSGGTDGNYSILKIDAPVANPNEATLSLMTDGGSGNYRFVDLYNMQYTDGRQWGLRQRYSGIYAATPFMIDFFNGTVRDPMLAILPSGNVGVGVSTSTLEASGAAFLVASTTASSSFQAVTATAFGIAGKFFADASQMWTNLNMVFTNGFTVSGGTVDMSAATVRLPAYKGVSWPPVTATTTTATSSVSLGIAMVATDLEHVTCRVTSGSGSYQFSDGTNKTDYRAASTTASRYTFTTNDTFTVDEDMFLEVGPMTNAQIICGVDLIQN